MTTKAWKIKLNDCDTAYVLAATREKAVAKAIREHPSGDGHFHWADVVDWKEFGRWRRADLDGEFLTMQPLVEAGEAWIECAGCGCQIDMEGGEPNDDAVFAAVAVRPMGENLTVWANANTAFCCQECFDKHREHAYLWPESAHGDYLLLSSEY